MTASAATERVAHLVDPRWLETIDVLGPTIQYLTSPDAGEGEPCVMRGTIPPGVAVPLHSHADPETFLMVSGEPAVMIIVTTPKMGRFFRELGVPAGTRGSDPPDDATIQRFLATSERYGYWNATPEENAEVGLQLG
jgi:hypothetical protein